MKCWKLSPLVLYVVFVSFQSLELQAQNDPGPRPGPPGAGGFYSSLSANEQTFFNQAQQIFMEIDSVSGGIPAETGKGLGPTFNGNSCAQCHAQPATGGSSPGLASPQNPIANPQVALATLDSALNSVPSFISPNGPVREARFVKNANGTLDGGVHGLYTIAGRSDAAGCGLGQPDFASALSADNVIFRIPTPTFGLGLVEATPDSVLQANLAATQAARSALKILGNFNTSGNDGTITRFGWKAQNKSLLVFAGEAYNVEQGVSNENFPNERSAVPGCVFNASPEDATPLVNGNSARPGELCGFHTSVGPAHSGAADDIHPARSGALQFDRLLALPLAHAHDGAVPDQRNVQRDLQPLFGLRPPQHGERIVGWHSPGQRRP
jgi:Di-haem oxidoreductase, putative peroxidase